MKFTGERFVPTEQGRIRLEHYHRYTIILNVLSKKDVLDVACGEGYGSSIMADAANSVIGVDISEVSVQHALSSYQKSNLSFQQGSALKLSFPDDSFDVVVSFETVEHLIEQEEMISEIGRVLRPGGVFIISSPNRPIFHEEYGSENDFHVKELDFREFDELLSKEFKFVDYYGQRMIMGSMIKSVNRESPSYNSWHDNGDVLLKGTGKGVVDPVYYIAICTNDKNDMPLVEPSLVFPDETDLVRYYLSLAKWAQLMDKKVKELEAEVKELEAEVGLFQNKISLMTHSLSWKITHPMRIFKYYLKKLLRLN